MELNRLLIVKFVKISFPFLSFPFLSFPFLSFPAYSQDSNSEENKPLIPSNEKEYKAAEASITEHINNAVDHIKKEEEKIVYDRKLEGQSVFSDGNESVSGLYNKPIDGRSYLFALQSSRPPVNNLKLINITDIASITEVFSTRWGQNGQYGSGINNLAYIENNGNITGKGTRSEESAIHLRSKNDFYFKNNGKITTNTSGWIRANNIMVLENKGYFYKHGISGGEAAILNSGKLDDMSIDGGDLYFSNTGEFNNTRGGHPISKREYINTVGLNELFRSYDQLISFMTDPFAERPRISANNLYGVNSGKLSGYIQMTFKDGYFINSGKIDGLLLMADKGLFVNRGTALVNIYGGTQTLTVDLKNSTLLKNSYIDRKQAETRVIVNEKTIIEDILEADGANETLVVSRDKDSELHHVEAGMDKYVGFEHLEMQGKWDIKEHDAKFNQSITFNNAEIELAGKTLNSPEVKNSESSAINVTSNADVKGNFTNQGTVSLTGTLTTSGNVENSGTIEFNNGLQGTKLVATGDYSGSGKSLLKMNVDASAGKTEFDLLKVDGKASGTTKIEFRDPTKLVAKMKNRVKLVQTKSSDENAFSLVESKYGRYKYKFYNVAHDTDGYSNWYLEQLPTFRKEVAGIVSGFAASQSLFTHTFHDRAAKDKLPEEHTAWVRVYHHNTKYQLNGVDSKADAHSDTLQLGYDALKYNKGTNKFTAGAYVSLGRQKSETYLVEDDERVRSTSKGYSLGLYATWEKPNWYVDSWIQVNRLKTKVNTSDERSDYKTTALQASLEAGYNKLLKQTDNYAYYVQPQGQVIYNHFHKPDMGEELAVLNPRYFVTRLGVRFYQQSLKHPNHGEPYLALNWWHHTNQTSVVTDEKAISIKGIKDLKNIEVGIDKWRITDNLSVWTNVGYYMGTHNYRDIRYNLGASYRF
ncbi:autotransporter outer membrane beta-barrel domain-containing protein [Haemophilus haemolyticus]|uniref:autotransporter family protein n=1 Tax=Haemophilus haemolyticus TaxID=726 RepID=UPI000E58A150|nr:autotransporter outer membrane beta-barrel domain-containing protein [Haemophilus haemolyticus]